MSASIQPTIEPRDSIIPRLKADASPRVSTRRITIARGSSRFSTSFQVWSSESSSTTMTSAGLFHVLERCFRLFQGYFHARYKLQELWRPEDRLAQLHLQNSKAADLAASEMIEHCRNSECCRSSYFVITWSHDIQELFYRLLDLPAGQAQTGRKIQASVPKIR